MKKVFLILLIASMLIGLFRVVNAVRKSHYLVLGS